LAQSLGLQSKNESARGTQPPPKAAVTLANHIGGSYVGKYSLNLKRMLGAQKREKEM